MDDDDGAAEWMRWHWRCYDTEDDMMSQHFGLGTELVRSQEDSKVYWLHDGFVTSHFPHRGQ